jgi:recombination associated protein RdgC
MFKNALVFQIDQWEQPTLEQFEERLDTGRFVECGASQPESAGWVPPRGDKSAPLAENVAGQIILKLWRAKSRTKSSTRCCRAPSPSAATRWCGWT